MYEQFFGLRERPFDLTPDPRSLVLTQSRYEALDSIAHSITAQEAVTLVLGEAGSGKSSIIRAAMARQPVRVQCLHLQHPRLMQPELVQILVACFGLSAWAARSRRKLRSELERVLIERRSRGEMTALVIDEAQRLAPDVLEEIRLLASMETKSGKLMTVVIAGQPELAVRLDTSRLRKLNQQIGLRCELRPLAPRETAMYLAERIRSAGGAGARLFTREAVSAIYEQSHGMPRLINVIADSALLAGYAVVQRPVGADIVREVCRDVVPRKSVGRPSALESARALVSQGRAYNGGATAAIPSFVAVYEPAPMVEVIPEPAIAREVVPQVTTAVEEIQELPIAVAVVPEPAIEVETVPEPAIALTAAADPVIAVAALPEPVAFAQRVTTPPPAEPSASDDDDSEIKEIFFSTYFQKVWEGPQETG